MSVTLRPIRRIRTYDRKRRIYIDDIGVVLKDSFFQVMGVVKRNGNKAGYKAQRDRFGYEGAWRLFGTRAAAIEFVLADWPIVEVVREILGRIAAAETLDAARDSVLRYIATLDASEWDDELAAVFGYGDGDGTGRSADQWLKDQFDRSRPK